ncbi:unnamed protein product [Sphagnum tenellum]
MSFTHIRKFVVAMKSLGYPHTISLEDFCSPNFKLVADCLTWLMLRYDPTIELKTDISTESHRVAFLQSATRLMLSRARIKLNAKRLYSADGYAVKELLKIASILQLATRCAIVSEEDNTELGPSMRMFDLKATRVLVNEITKCGATFYDVLKSEPELHEARKRATMADMDMDYIERNMQDSINVILNDIDVTNQENTNVQNDITMLQTKYEKQKFELERLENRLSTLQNVRPAYMDEYELLKKELNELFLVYVEKSRNLQWLESQREIYNREEQEKLEEVNRKMRRLQRRVQNEELCILQGEEVAEDVVNMDSSEDSSEDEKTNSWTWLHRESSKLKEQEVKEDNVVDINQTSAEELDDDSSDDDF